MTEGQIQGKWFWVWNNREFEITEFELAGSNCTRHLQVNKGAYPFHKLLTFIWLAFSLQVDFEALTRVTGIATQGRYDAEQWVKTYRLTYSRDGSSYKYYTERRVIKVTCVLRRYPKKRFNHVILLPVWPQVRPVPNRCRIQSGFQLSVVKSKPK